MTTITTTTPLTERPAWAALRKHYDEIRDLLDPAAVPFFPPTDPSGMARLARIGMVAGGPRQLLLTAASMVGCINAIVGGVAVALAVRSLLDGPVPVAAVTGAVVALGLAALSFGYQVRRIRRAAAVAPELYEGQSPDMPGWTERTNRRKS